MFSKTLFVLAFTAIAQVVVAAPPACMLGAVNTYSNPADIASVCKAKDATAKISKMCGSDAKDALAAFADVCNGKGVKVSTDIISATGTAASGSPTATGNGTTLATTIATATGGSVPTGSSASATRSGAPQSTGAAGKLDLSAAALLAGLGFVAAAL